MARNQSNPWKIIAVLFGVILLTSIAGTGVFFFLQTSDKISKLSPLPVDAYLSGKTLWSAEDYQLEGRVDNVIFRGDDPSILVVSVQPSGTSRRLPLLVKTKPGTKPLQREMDLLFKVSIGPKNQLLCSDYRAL
jgi:hypothetical protein